MWQAVVALVGVVVGGAIAGGVALRQAQLFTEREREARLAEREQARKDARDVLQRDTILALQDAVADLVRMVIDLHGEAVTIEEKTGHWPPPTPIGELPASFDDALRRLVADVAWSGLGALHAADRGGAARLMAGLSETNEQLQERVHALLKKLF